MEYKNQKISLIIPVIFLLVSIVFFFFLNKEIRKNIDTIGKVKLELQEELAKRNEIKTLNNYFKLIEKEKSQLETHFIQNSNVVPFLDTLENLATSVEVKTEVSSINLAKDNSGLIVEIKNVGTFSQIYKFITLLENAPYELEFISVNVQKAIIKDDSGSEVESNKWEAMIKLKLISFA